MKRGAKTFSCWLPIITNFLLLKAFHTLIKLHVPQQFPTFLEIPHPADRMTFTSKALNRVLTYTYELPMGVASQNRFWLIHKLASCEVRDDFSREKFSKSEFDTTKSALAVEQQRPGGRNWPAYQCGFCSIEL